jgi:hypothetical protein
MSQIITEPAEPAESRAAQFDPGEEFAYRPVPPLAPISLFLGLCGLSGFVGVPCLAVGFVGVLVGMVALWQIRRSAGTLGGKGIARLGIGLSALMFVAGSGYHAYGYATEVPEGYQRISFVELSKHEPKLAEGRIEVAPEVASLDGKPIFIKGYMYPSRQRSEISEFVLVKDTGQCCFGGQPKLTDMIIVKFDEGLTVNYREQQLVGVAGVFRANSVAQAEGLTSIYVLEGTHFK